MDTTLILKMSESFYKLAKKLSLKEILKELSGFDTFKDRNDYAENNLKHLSSGSSRVVFLTPEKTVVKLAKNEKGIAQNKEEFTISCTSKFVNKIISSDKNFIWIEVPYLEKITEKDFEKLTGFLFKDLEKCLDYSDSKKSSKKPDNFDTISKKPIYKNLLSLIKDYKLLSGDIVRISSWGKKNNTPVLIDTGLTSKVYNKYYKSSSSS